MKRLFAILALFCTFAAVSVGAYAQGTPADKPAATAPAAAAVHATTRQRGPGGAPVGNSSGTSASRQTKAGTKVQLPSQAT